MFIHVTMKNYLPQRVIILYNKVIKHKEKKMYRTHRLEKMGIGSERAHSASFRVRWFLIRNWLQEWRERYPLKTNSDLNANFQLSVEVYSCKTVPSL